MANGTADKIESEGLIPEGKTINGGFRDFFHKKDDVLSVSKNRFRVTPGPHEAQAYCSE